MDTSCEYNSCGTSILLYYVQFHVNLMECILIYQKEIDFVEESNGIITAYEFKWNPKSKVKIPKLFLEAYAGSEYKMIHPDNFEDLLL